jgi:hypothetical protein
MAPKSMQIFKFNFSTNYFKFVETNLKGRRYQEMIKNLRWELGHELMSVVVSSQ